MIGARSPRSGAAATPSAASVSRCARRLCSDAAAGVYRSERPVNLGAGPNRAARRKSLPVVADFLSARAAFQLVPQPPATKSISSAPMPRGAGRRPDARTGGARLRVRNRRQRQSRHAVGTGVLAASPRDLDCDRLQSAADHQQRRPARRAGPRIYPRRAKGSDLVGCGAAGDGAQDRGAEADGGGGQVGARRMVAAREDRHTPQGWAMHAMVLDIDVGPLLQTHKLLTSVLFARLKGYTRHSPPPNSR